MIDDEEWKKCHSKAQKEAKKAQHVKASSNAQKDEKVKVTQNTSDKKAPDAAKSDPICSSSGWCGEKFKHSKDKEEKIVEYKTGLPLDKDIRDSQEHMSSQEAIHGTWTIDKDPAKYANKKQADKTENKEIQFDQKV